MKKALFYGSSFTWVLDYFYGILMVITKNIIIVRFTFGAKPMYPELSSKAISQTIDSIKGYYGR